MTWPTELSVRESIVQNIVTTLESIQTPTYSRSIKQVSLLGAQAPSRLRYPCVLIGTPSVDYEDQRTDMIACTMTVPLTVGVQEGSASQGTKHRELLDSVEDVRKALILDHTRGELATDTVVVSDEPFALDTTEPVMLCNLAVRVHYRHARYDTTEAL